MVTPPLCLAMANPSYTPRNQPAQPRPSTLLLNATKLRNHFSLKDLTNYDFLTMPEAEDRFFYESMERVEYVYTYWDTKGHHEEQLCLRPLEHSLSDLCDMHMKRAFSKRFVSQPEEKAKALDAMTKILSVMHGKILKHCPGVKANNSRSDVWMNGYLKEDRDMVGDFATCLESASKSVQDVSLATLFFDQV